MYQPHTIYSEIALNTIIAYLKNKKDKKVYAEDFLLEKRACFVSLHKKDGALRGCIGTIEPRENNLIEEIKRNAISAAFHDNRFQAASLEELEDIEISVDVLTIPEKIININSLDPKIYGVIVSDGSIQRAVLLPSIPDIETIEQQLAVVKKKAGLTHLSNEELIIYRFSSTRYH